MFSCSVFVCLGFCHGCEPTGARALTRPDGQGPALEYYSFHHHDWHGKRESRRSAAPPNVTSNVITDHYRWLFGDLTGVERTRMTVLSFFPPGSRAAVPKLPMENISDVSVITCHLADEDTENAGGSLKAETSKWWHILRKMTSPWIWGSVVTATIVVALCTKRPEHGGPLSELQCSCRAPPAWLPEADHYYYNFQAYVIDVSQWTMLTDLTTYQKRLAVIMCLGEPAREFARMISPQEIMTGIWHNGKLLDPGTYLWGVLQLRCVKVKEEMCQQYMIGMSMSAGRPGGILKAVLARDQAVRERIAEEGHSVTNIEGRMLQGHRIAGNRLHQLMIQRRPFSGTLPDTGVEHQTLQIQACLQQYAHVSALSGGVAASQDLSEQARPCRRYVEMDYGRSTLQLLHSGRTDLRQLGTLVHRPIFFRVSLRTVEARWPMLSNKLEQHCLVKGSCLNLDLQRLCT